MIIEHASLHELRGAVSMVDGGFDPLHGGHVAYFREAAAIGLPVLCNISSDDWIARKHPAVLPQEERGLVIDAIRWIDYVHLSQTTTAAILAELRPRYYVKGADWRGRLPAEEKQICSENGTEVLFLDTVTNSSSAILERYQRQRED